MEDIPQKKSSLTIMLTGEKIDPKTPENKVGQKLNLIQ